MALLDAVAIHWLLCIDHRLVGIVKTEFATELKTLRLSQMVKTISKSIDDGLIAGSQSSKNSPPPQNPISYQLSLNHYCYKVSQYNSQIFS